MYDSKKPMKPSMTGMMSMMMTMPIWMRERSSLVGVWGRRMRMMAADIQKAINDSVNSLAITSPSSRRPVNTKRIACTIRASRMGFL